MIPSIEIDKNTYDILNSIKHHISNILIVGEETAKLNKCISILMGEIKTKLEIFKFNKSNGKISEDKIETGINEMSEGVLVIRPRCDNSDLYFISSVLKKHLKNSRKNVIIYGIDNFSGATQNLLLDFMNYSSAKFIFTCSNISAIIKPITFRCCFIFIRCSKMYDDSAWKIEFSNNKIFFENIVKKNITNMINSIKNKNISSYISIVNKLLISNVKSSEILLSVLKEYPDHSWFISHIDLMIAKGRRIIIHYILLYFFIINYEDIQYPMEFIKT